MTRPRPTVSVCVPTYNQARYLGPALESVLAQTFADFEIVVSDDASTDQTPDVLAGIRDPRLRAFRQARNVGIGPNRNTCLAAARGRYVAWLDSDDLYCPDRLATQTAVLDRHPDVGLVHGAAEAIDQDGQPLGGWPPPFDGHRIDTGRRALAELIASNYVTTSTVMVRRACYDRVGLYATDVDGSEDWDMWLRIACHYDLAYTATPLARYRQHADSISVRLTRDGARLHRDTRLVRRLLAREIDGRPDGDMLGRRARAALAAKALAQATGTLLVGQRVAALRAVVLAWRIAGSLLPAGRCWLLLTSVARGDEYAAHRRARSLLGRLYPHLAGTRYGERIRKQAVADPEWQAMLHQVARTVRRVIPEDARLAVVDKCDPTVLHLTRRRGWHFPDPRLMPDGYPADSAGAIEHLEQLRARGAAYLVLPSGAFWWLEHYQQFGRHLEGRYRKRWADERCAIYDLSLGESA